MDCNPTNARLAAQAGIQSATLTGEMNDVCVVCVYVELLQAVVASLVLNAYRKGAAESIDDVYTLVTERPRDLVVNAVEDYLSKKELNNAENPSKYTH